MAQPINLSRQSVAIGAGTSLTPEIDLSAGILCGIATDANWTAEPISILASNDGTNFLPVQNAAGSLTFGTLAASTFLALDPTIYRGINSLKIQSGAAGSAVNQTNATTLTVVSRPNI